MPLPIYSATAEVITRGLSFLLTKEKAERIVELRECKPVLTPFDLENVTEIPAKHWKDMVAHGVIALEPQELEGAVGFGSATRALPDTDDLGPPPSYAHIHQSKSPSPIINEGDQPTRDESAKQFERILSALPADNWYGEHRPHRGTRVKEITRKQSQESVDPASRQYQQRDSGLGRSEGGVTNIAQSNETPFLPKGWEQQTFPKRLAFQGPERVQLSEDENSDHRGTILTPRTRRSSDLQERILDRTHIGHQSRITSPYSPMHDQEPSSSRTPMTLPRIVRAYPTSPMPEHGTMFPQSQVRYSRATSSSKNEQRDRQRIRQRVSARQAHRDNQYIRGQSDDQVRGQGHGNMSRHQWRRDRSDSDISSSNSRRGHHRRTRGHRRRSSSSSGSSSMKRARRRNHGSRTSSTSSEETYHRRHRRKSPQPPKLSIFTGEKNWDGFIYQFERYALRYGWSRRRMAERLVDCLGGKALDYVREMKLEGDFKRLKRKLGKRFGIKEAPITVRRELQYLKQEEKETLNEFSQRVHFQVIDGFPGAKEKTINQLAVEHFLRGCLDKRAAATAMGRDPRTIHKAVQYVKDAMNNYKAIYGKSGHAARKVSFVDYEDSDKEQGPETHHVRTVHTAEGKQKASDDMEKEFGKRMDNLETLIKQLMRSRTPPPRFRSPASTPTRSTGTPPRSPLQPKDAICFNCRTKGHFQKDCPSKVAEKPEVPNLKE